MGHFAELFDYGGVYLGDAVAVHVQPDRGGPIVVPAPLRVFEPAPIALHDDEGILLVVLGHLGVGVPDVVPVQPG